MYGNLVRRFTFCICPINTDFFSLCISCLVDEEMEEAQSSKTDIWKSKGQTDVAMDTLPATHVVNTLLQVILCFVFQQNANTKMDIIT